MFNISLESIEKQPDGKYDPLDRIFTSMRNDIVLDGVTNETIQKRYGRKLAKTIGNLFGMATNINFASVRNAFIMPLYANKRHTLASANLRDHMDSNELNYKVFDEAIKDLKKNKGYVNMHTARVGGAFSSYLHEITYDPYFFFKILRLSVRSAVSILLHELGHGFHLIEYSDRAHDVNTTMFEISKSMRGKNKREYTYLVKDLTKSGLDDATVDDIVNSSTRQIFSYKLSKAVFETMLTQETNKKYSEVSNERLADNFATRCGYGAELVTALAGWEPDTLWENHSTNCVLLSQLMLVAVPTALMFLFAGLPVVAFITLLSIYTMYVLIGFNSSNVNLTYDDGINRYRSVRDDLVQQLKDNRTVLSKNTMRAVIEQYDAIDKIIESKTVLNTMKNMLANVFSFQGKLAKEDIAKQRRLERLANNPMFIASMKIALA